MHIFRSLIFVCLFLSPAVFATAAPPDGVDAVYRYFSELKSFQAHFFQLVQDGKGETMQQSEGEVWIAKPGRFRWNYKTPFEQQIVATGTELWTFDPDLEQATVKPIDAILSITPAMILSGHKNLEDMAEVKLIGTSDQEYWFKLTPKNQSETLDTIEIAFYKQQLHAIRIFDSFNNTTTITFSEQQLNKPLPASLFSIDLPEGTDILGKGE